jgi:hypothetical protein
MHGRLAKTLTAVLVVLMVALAGEGLLRLKNANQLSHHVEMWRYAKELKQRDPDPAIGHSHRANSSARLQRVHIALDSFGMRGPEPDLGDHDRKRVLLLGSSITLGWGVAEGDSLRARLERGLEGRAQVWNAGIGNFNAGRYTALYERLAPRLEPDIVVVHYFLRDAEPIPPPSDNILMRHSQLALMAWQAVEKALRGRAGLGGIEEHYRKLYAEDSEARRTMEASLTRLAADTRGKTVILAMMPDIHNLRNYPFKAIHAQMKSLAEGLGWRYVDLLPALESVPQPEALYAIPGDPHPNADGHRLMAEALLPMLRDALR